MDKTAPEVTDSAVKSAEKQDCVIRAENRAEWMYVEYTDDVTEEEKQRVERHFNRRLERQRGHDGENLSKIGLHPQGNFEIYFLVPSPIYREKKRREQKD